MKYEYRLEEQIRAEDFIGHLNALGSEGWHVLTLTAAVEYTDNVATSQVYTILLERGTPAA